MTGTNPPTSVGGPPSAAAIARAGQGMKQTAQAAFEGTLFFFYIFLLISMQCNNRFLICRISNSRDLYFLRYIHLFIPLQSTNLYFDPYFLQSTRIIPFQNLFNQDPFLTPW